MTYIQTITNGNLPVPREIQEALQWSKTNLKVRIEPTKNGFNVQKVAYDQIRKKKITKKEAARIWANMKQVSKLGKQDMNLTEFLRHDRDTHF